MGTAHLSTASPSHVATARLGPCCPAWCHVSSEALPSWRRDRVLRCSEPLHTAQLPGLPSALGEDLSVESRLGLQASDNEQGLEDHPRTVGEGRKQDPHPEQVLTL